MEEKDSTKEAGNLSRPPVSETASLPPPRPRVSLGSIMVVVIALAVIIATERYYVRFIEPYETTDDAFIESYVTFVSPRVSGPVVKLLVKDNQRVKAGEVLLEIDPRDYQTLLDQAKADQQKAAVVAAQAIAERAKTDFGRYESVESQAVSRSQLDLAKAQAGSAGAEVEVAGNQAKAAIAQVDLDRANVATARAQVQQAQTRLEEAQLQLSYTEVAAPRDGRVTRRSVEQGAYVQTGQALLALVPDDLWVVANFKETQLERMRPGQPVVIQVDAYPRHAFKGKLDSVQAGSGALFSLLPPENAVGNYVKVVQRVPVKILFDDPAGLSQFNLAPGMSVRPKVRVQ